MIFALCQSHFFVIWCAMPDDLKRAWQFMLDNPEYPADYSYICKTNRIVGGDNLVYGAGYLRD